MAEKPRRVARMLELLLTEFLQKPAATAEGDSNLLDGTMVFFGSGMNNGSGLNNGGGTHGTDKLTLLFACGEKLGDLFHIKQGMKGKTATADCPSAKT